MANTKQVHAEAWIPFNWASNLTDEEARCWAAWLLGPSTGLKLTYERGCSMQPNDHGGQTAMYLATISGTEAINGRALAILADSWRRQQYAEVVFEAADLDAYGPDEAIWETVQTVEEYDEMVERIRKEFEDKKIVFGEPRPLKS